MTRNPQPSTRRRVLTIAGSSALLGIAGCLGDSSGGGGGDGDSMDDGGSTNEEMGDEGMDDQGSMDDDSVDEGMDPDDAPSASIDRFSDSAGTLHVRGSDGDLPDPDEPIDFDERFLTTGFGPDGEVVQYYDFDVQPTVPAPIYAFVHENGDPVEEQRNVVGVVPGDEGYNDFWQVHTVTVPDDYEPNTVTDAGSLMAADYDVEATGTIKNCPIVPEGSTASMRHGDGSTDLVEGWYDGEVVYYFLFEEASLEVQDGNVPLSPIYVAFETNPGEDGGGPASGFATEAGSDQTHNVVATVPGDEGYSPLWDVNIYDNAAFESVSDVESALDAELRQSSAAHVNCPVVSVN